MMIYIMNEIYEKILAIKISRDSGNPLYAQISEEIEKILQGVEEKKKARLPSIRNISAALNTSYLTVNKSLQCLVAKGLIKSYGNSGFHIKSKAPLNLPVAVFLGDFRSYMNSCILQGISRVLAANNTEMLTYSYAGINIRDTLESLFTENRIQGIIAYGDILPLNKPLLEKISPRIPLVLLNYRGKFKASGIVNSDDKTGEQYLAKALATKGHKNIIHFSSDKNHSVGAYRREVFTRRARELGLRVTTVTNVNSPERAYLETKCLFVEKKSFTAIACWCDPVAFGVLRYLNESNIKIPGDIAVTGYGNIEFSETQSPPLTTVEQNFVLTGAKAAEILAMPGKNNPGKTTKIFSPVELIERETL
jgi:DNA-binding LacI/PurR family transcriptional regulator